VKLYLSFREYKQKNCFMAVRMNLTVPFLQASSGVQPHFVFFTRVFVCFVGPHSLQIVLLSYFYVNIVVVLIFSRICGCFDFLQYYI
jgi:hypothetical protein